jgi:histidinol-phosphate aminotransferase
MPVSRRGFFEIIAAGRTDQLSDALRAARGNGEYAADLAQQGGAAPTTPASGAKEVRISLNENPLGPGKAVIDAILGKFPEANRYPFNSTPLDADLEILIGKLNNATRESVVLGVGSQEILRNAVRVYMSPTKHLAEAQPTYSNCSGQARQLGWPIKTVPVDANMRIDLKTLMPLTKGAGIVHVCNPNNPTGTIVNAKELAAFIAEVRKTSPTSLILVDEAYHDYVTDPTHESAIALAITTPNVMVVRTFSKAHGMAGVRIGYGIGMPATIAGLKKYRMPYNVNTFACAAGIASLKDPAHIKAEATRNKTVRDFTVKALADMGFKSSDSQGNFIFVNIGNRMTAAQFREGCAKSNVIVGRDFPPLEKTWARISMGTMDEMQRAVDVFRSVLRPATPTAGQQQ